MINTIAHRPGPVVTAGDTEPEPQHERDTSNPDKLQPLPQREPGRTLNARAGLVEDMEDEDNRRGYEDEPAARLGRHLRRAGNEQRGHIGWRAPRTAQEMQRRLPLIAITHTCRGRTERPAVEAVQMRGAVA